MSNKTILGAHTHTHTHTHTHAVPQAPTCKSMLYTFSNTYLAYKQLTMEEDSSVRGENIAGLLLWKKKYFEVGAEGVFREEGEGLSL